MKLTLNANSLNYQRKREKLHQVIFHLRPIWHLKLYQFRNESILKKDNLVSNVSILLQLEIAKLLQIEAVDKLFNLDQQNFDTKTSNIVKEKIDIRS